MTGGFAAFVTLAINPFGGLLIAIPFAMLKMLYPVWLVLIVGVPLAYFQVVAVDLGWTTLARWPWWHRYLDKKRSKRIERLTASGGAFWLTVILSPLIGPWLVMAFMRYANVSHRRVALPMFLGLCWNAAAIAAVCIIAPRLFHV